MSAIKLITTGGYGNTCASDGVHRGTNSSRIIIQIWDVQPFEEIEFLLGRSVW